MTDIKQSEDSKKKKSDALKGRKRNPEICRKISIGLTGKKLSDVTKHKLSLFNKGRYAGGKHPMAKKIIDEKTGIIYNCLNDAAKEFGYDRSTIRAYLTNRRPNPTYLKYYAA